MSRVECDFLVIGAGIAGAATAWRLAEHGRTVLCDVETQAAYHSTGRTVALFDRTYGNAPIRALTVASESFLRAPPLPVPGPVLSPRGVLHVADGQAAEDLAAWYEDIRESAPTARLLDGQFARDRVPILRRQSSVACVWDPEAADIDVARLMAALIQDFRHRGGLVRLGTGVARIDWLSGGWIVGTSGPEMSARVIVNAAGAWADIVAANAGMGQLGLVAMRRSVAVIDAPAGYSPADWPFTVDARMSWYFKGERGRMLVSPAEEVPTEPGDAVPDDFDLAAGIDRFESAVTVPVDRVLGRWAGLRSFFADGTPVVGSDPRRPEFIWCAGLGGYGIQVAPAVSALAAAAARGVSTPLAEVAPALSAGREIGRR